MIQIVVSHTVDRVDIIDYLIDVLVAFVREHLRLLQVGVVL